MTAPQHHEQEPRLSVVLPAWDTFDSVRETVKYIAAQAIAPDIELLVCTPDPASFGLDERATQALHSVQLVETGPLTETGPPRARAIRRARAPIIAFAEDHCYPDAGWAEALLTAHEEPHAAVSPVVRNANPETIISRADLIVGYGRWHAPGCRGTVTLLPGHQTSYKRALLLEYGDELDRMMEAETVLLWDLHRRGYTLLLETRATVAHVNFTRLSTWLDTLWHVGRVFAATRVAHWSLPRRVAYAVATPAIPFIRGAGVVRYGIRNGVPLRDIVVCAPAIVAGLCVDFVSQAAGALFGMGDSLPRLAAYEFRRDEVNRTGKPVTRHAA